jgi:hypothetical protein
MITYKLCPIARQNTESKAVLRFNENGSVTSIPMNEANTDYVAYLKWIEEGNVPEPAEE